MQLHPALIVATLPPYIQVRYLYKGGNLPNVCRPVFCSPYSGFHWMPQQGDRIWVAFIEGSMPTALLGLTLFDDANQSAGWKALVALGLQEGESAILSPTDSALKALNTGAFTLGMKDASGNPTPSLTVNGGVRRAAAVGDSVSVNLTSGNGTITGSNAPAGTGGIYLP